MLWPLGGVAYVKPPQRPGATLWAIAAGPLVNVALAPLLYGALWPRARRDGRRRRPMRTAFGVSVLDRCGLFVFKHPARVSAGWRQILRSVLWFFMSRGRSLMTATVIGSLVWRGLRGWRCGRATGGWADCGVREKQLLEQLQSGAGDGEAGEDSAARGVLRARAAGWLLRWGRFGSARVARSSSTHLPAGGVPALRDAVSHDGLPGLQRAGAVERVGGGDVAKRGVVSSSFGGAGN